MGLRRAEKTVLFVPCPSFLPPASIAFLLKLSPKLPECVLQTPCSGNHFSGSFCLDRTLCPSESCILAGMGTLRPGWHGGLCPGWHGSPASWLTWEACVLAGLGILHPGWHGRPASWLASEACACPVGLTCVSSVLICELICAPTFPMLAGSASNPAGPQGLHIFLSPLGPAASL